MLSRNIYINPMFFIGSKQAIIQTSSVDRMIQLLRYIGFVRRTVQAIATSSIFTDMMIFKR